MFVSLSRRYLRPYWGAILAVVLLQFVQAGAALALPTLNADIIDYGVVQGDIPYIWGRGGIMLAITAVQAAAAISISFLASRSAMRVGRDLRHDVVGRVQSFGGLEITRFTPPSLITRATNDVQQIQMTLLMTFMIMIQAPVMMVGGVVMAIRQDAVLSWLLVAIIPILAAIMTVAMLRMAPLFAKQQTRIDNINTVMREQLTGARVIRAFVRQDAERERFRVANEDLRDVATKVGMWMAFLFPSVMFIVMAAQTGVIWFGGFRIDSGEMMVGSLVAFLNYLMQIFMSVMMTVMMFMVVPRAEVCAKRVSEVLETAPSIVSPADSVPMPDGVADLTFDGVTVRYTGAEADVLKSVSFTVPAGSTTAVIGSTGSGKTTLINLLPRILDIASGAIRWGDVDLREVSLDELRARFALVPQRAFLFSGTIASNLRVAKTDATDEELWAALETAQASEFVRELEEGLEAPVEQGGKNFSGGQRQRLTIARALVRKADLTVFDDSFSALDYATDARLRAALPRYLGGRSVMIIAQRVATIRRADQIIVLDDGQIVGIGTHSELMATSETYREIVLSQISAEEAA
ncbi:MAG TPA: ABC transporter ATP-binding protein [Actinomycetaceae bacterium]|nr:ABC transporter ATP-binding protein [Actinomycetaceae bacterium]